MSDKEAPAKEKAETAEAPKEPSKAIKYNGVVYDDVKAFRKAKGGK